MPIFTNADYESFITTEYIEELVEEFGLDEIGHTISAMRELNSETQEFTAISGSSGDVVTDRFFVCVDFWEPLENDTYAYNYDRSYIKKLGKYEFSKAYKAIIAGDFRTLDKMFPHKSVVRYKAQKGDK